MLPMMRRVGSAALLALILPGCAPAWRHIPADAKKGFEQPVPLSAETRATVESRLARTWVGIALAERILALESRGDGFVLRTRGVDSGMGRAVCITADGFFLTAAHCCLGAWGETPWLIHGEGDGWRARRSRLVWKDEAADLALLATDDDSSELVLTASVAPPAPGDVVLAGGRESNSAGTVLGCWPEPDAPMRNYLFILHTAPCINGDSGGPLLDANGRLVGIQTHSGIAADGHVETKSVRYDPRILEAILAAVRGATPEHDRARSALPDGAASSSPTGDAAPVGQPITSSP